MQLKLVMSYGGDVGWMLRSGSILKWHKNEGQEVRYGDELFDMRVEEIVMQAASLERRLIRQHTLRGWTDHQSWAEQTGAKNVTVDNSEGNRTLVSSKRPFIVRVTASDQGILRKRVAKQHDRIASGDLLALLTTTPDESFDAGDKLKDASIFRVVVNRIRGEGAYANLAARTLAGKDFLIFWSERENSRRTGISCYGGLTANPVFGAAPFLSSQLQGRCCIVREGALALRSDILVQSLAEHPRMEEIVSRLNLPPGSLRPALFENTIHVRTEADQEEFPKSVLVLSIASDVQSFCFRHIETGILVPPEAAYKLGSLEDMEWFEAEFAPAGWIDVNAFTQNFAKVIQTIFERTRTHIVVFNSFTTSPCMPAHNYAFLSDHDGARRLEFNLALTELSRKLDFSILDMDRIAKRLGTAGQLDWDMATPDLSPAIASQMYELIAAARFD